MDPNRLRKINVVLGLMKGVISLVLLSTATTQTFKGMK